MVTTMVSVDADTMCVGENASDSTWPRRRYRRSSHNLFLVSERYIDFTDNVP